MVQCTCTSDNGNNNTKFTGDFGMYYLAGKNYTCTRKSLKNVNIDIILFYGIIMPVDYFIQYFSALSVYYVTRNNASVHLLSI